MNKSVVFNRLQEVTPYLGGRGGLWEGENHRSGLGVSSGRTEMPSGCPVLPLSDTKNTWGDPKVAFPGHKTM